MTTIYLVSSGAGDLIACPTHSDARKLSATLRTGRKVPENGPGSIREVELATKALGARGLACALFNRAGYANNPTPGGVEPAALVVDGIEL